MKKNNIQSRCSFILSRNFKCSSACAVMFILAASGAFAQETVVDEGPVEEIIITGSRIPRSGFETLQPATVLDSEKLDLRGNISLAKSLN